MTNAKSAFVAFVCFFALYLATLGPALAPYRDSGEMAVVADTLGVAHPTSYPSYIMLGHAAQKLPLGNRAYRLGLLSAVVAGACCAALFAWAAARWGFAAGAGAALLLGLNATFWSIAQVQEMYSLWMLAAVLLMALAARLRDAYSDARWRAFVLLFAAALTNRLDLLLWAPGLLWLALGQAEEKRAPLWAALAFLIFPAAIVLSGSNAPIVLLIALTAWWRCPRGDRPRWLASTAGWALLGLAAYSYLPVRSARGPWLDWNHPAIAANFVESLLRTRYGGTLDLLSKNYATGELFLDNLRLYGKHVWENFWAPGLALSVWGAWTCAKRDGRRWLGMAAAYWWSGPVFLFIANMPPNPHAAAIVEPHYLLSDLVLVFWAAEGLGAVAAAGAPVAAIAAAALLAGPLWHGRLRQFDRRQQLDTYDFARSTLASAPDNAIVVVRKDVQLYTLWSFQRLQGWRPDVRVVAQGLAGADWYQDDWRRRDASLAVTPLRDAEGWKRFIALNGGNVLATPDAELPPELSVNARGRLYEVGPAVSAPRPWIWALDSRRGKDADYFTSDLIESRAQALFRQGAALLAAGRPGDAEDFLLSAWSAQWRLPDAPFYLGFLHYSAGDLEKSRAYYAAAARLFDDLLGLAASYRALPPVVDGIRRSAAEALTHLGAVTEKLGSKERALEIYERAAARYPLAQTQYNIAVLFWNSDWARVRRHLEQALRLDASHQDAARLLRRLKAQR